MPNNVKLQSEDGLHPLDENLRPLKIGDKTAPIELSEDTVKVKNLEITGTGKGSGFLSTTGGTMSGDITTDSDIISTGTFTIDSVSTINLDPANGKIDFDIGGVLCARIDCASNPDFSLYEFGDVNNYMVLRTYSNGLSEITTVDSGGEAGHLIITADGYIEIIAAKHLEFNGCAVGFDLETPTYNATDTDVDFTDGNKQFVTFGAGNITDLNLIFPVTSGNFTLLLKQDGTGSRTVTNYKAWDLVNSDAADGSATVKFAGGSNPTLTTDANHVDILSFFWDADNEIAYGVASLDFQF